MNRKRGEKISYENVYYQKVNQNEDDIKFSQFESHFIAKIPWRAIGLALALFIFGSLALITSLLVLIGHLDERYNESMWSLMFIGCLMFIPGAYHLRIAYYAYHQSPGYSYDNIPEF